MKIRYLLVTQQYYCIHYRYINNIFRKRYNIIYRKGVCSFLIINTIKSGFTNVHEMAMKIGARPNYFQI